MGNAIRKNICVLDQESEDVRLRVPMLPKVCRMHEENVKGRNSKKRLWVVNSGYQDSAGKLMNRSLPAFRRDKVSPILQAGAATAAEETSSRGAERVSWLFESEVQRQDWGAKA
jgi:hypothetical protein